jgi:CDP-glycerol glycerophosphotransferase (TagB/SpsB family)
MDIDESINILNTCSQLHLLVDTKIRILVKHHPAHESHAFIKQVPAFGNDTFTPTSDSMLDLLGSISLLISSASSACAEAASLGIPVAVYGNRYGVTMSPIANDINGFLNNVFYSENQLIEFIQLYLGTNGDNSSIERNFYMDNGESAQALFSCE